ncbi:hypothetical protein FA702_04595 [Novosphingobium sp. EMRT-2]|nr:hypothetical protein FA702_04595 [Novosphingobium sp. EMRT-2]
MGQFSVIISGPPGSILSATQHSGIQSSLYDLFNPEKGHRVPTHVFMRTDQEPDVPIKRKRRVIAA